MKYWRKVNFVLVLGISCILFFLPGCRRNEERRNLGVDDGIESFVYNFDPRDEVAHLVRDVKAGKFPEEISWHYDTNKGPKKKKYTVLNKTSDPEVIKEIYYALGDTIIVGISNNQDPVTDIDLTFTLSDGEACVFYFVSENTIRISGQNYVLEADGKLWTLLRSEEVETELEELPEAESEELSEAADEELTEVADEELTEAADEELTEALPETVVETETVSEAEDEELTEAADEQLTKALPETVVETETVSEAGVEELTEAADEELTEAADEELTEAADEELTEAQSEEISEAETESVSRRTKKDSSSRLRKTP